MATVAPLSAARLRRYGTQPYELQRRITGRLSFLSAISVPSASPKVPLLERRVVRHIRDEKMFSRVVVSALPDDLSSTITLSTAVATLLSFGGFRAFVYFRMQYIIAAMLGKYVPRGGCRVLDMNIHEGRNLYYYPSDIAEVVAITNNKNCEVVKNQAIRAGVPVDVNVKTLNTLSLPSNSMDAVVSVYCLSELQETETKTILREAIRSLKPGKPFIFVENVVAEGQFLRTCQVVLHKILQLFGIQGPLPKDLSRFLEEAEGLERLHYDRVFGFQDPHIVGLAMKQTQIPNITSKKRGIKKSASV